MSTALRHVSNRQMDIPVRPNISRDQLSGFPSDRLLRRQSSQLKYLAAGLFYCFINKNKWLCLKQ